MDENKKIHSFTDLIAWRESHKLVIMIYRITKKFPREEIFGLVSQMRRAAVSVSSNIAEGFCRRSKSDKNHFYNIAQSSNVELQNQLIIGRDVGYIDKEEFTLMSSQSSLAQRLIGGLMKTSFTININHA